MTHILYRLLNQTVKFLNDIPTSIHNQIYPRSSYYSPQIRYRFFVIVPLAFTIQASIYIKKINQITLTPFKSKIANYPPIDVTYYKMDQKKSAGVEKYGDPLKMLPLQGGLCIVLIRVGTTRSRIG